MANEIVKHVESWRQERAFLIRGAELFSSAGEAKKVRGGSETRVAAAIEWRRSATTSP